MSFNEDLSIENPLNEDSKIYTRIERINNTLKRDLESDCTKVLNIFNPNSKKYYEKLDSEQMKRYESRLQEEFNKQIKFFYEKSTTNGTNEVD
jgi:RNase H-fold protein (predicted Holliday junction resolvase)